MQALADKLRITAAQAQSIGQPSLAGKVRVCIASFTPEVYCHTGAPQDTYSGYQVELFKEIAREVYWLSDFNAWEFSCMEYKGLLYDINSPNGTCLIAPAALGPYDTVRPSWVVDREGVRILINGRRDASRSLFSPFEALSWPLWLSLAGTALLVGATVWCCDVAVKSLGRPPLRGRQLRRQRARERPPGAAGAPADPGARWESPAGARVAPGDGRGDAGQGRKGVAQERHEAKDAAGRRRQQDEEQQVVMQVDQQEEDQQGTCDLGEPSDRRILRWLGVHKGEEQEALKLLDTNVRRGFLKIARMSDPPITFSLPAQVILFAYGLLLIIMIAIYTAGTAARLTAEQLVGGIRGREDLKGRAVGAWDTDVQRLQEQGLEVIGLKWEGTEDEGAILDKLRSGSLAALVVNRNFADYMASSHCEFAAVGLPFAFRDFVYGYSLRMPQELARDVDRAIKAAVQSGLAERLRNINIAQQSGGATCSSSKLDGNTTITLQQMLGLWVMLAISMLAGVVILCFMWVRRRSRWGPLLPSAQASGAPAAKGMLRGGSDTW